jgi:hypothetical protein
VVEDLKRPGLEFDWIAIDAEEHSGVKRVVALK